MPVLNFPSITTIHDLPPSQRTSKNILKMPHGSWKVYDYEYSEDAKFCPWQDSVESDENRADVFAERKWLVRERLVVSTPCSSRRSFVMLVIRRYLLSLHPMHMSRAARVTNQRVTFPVINGSRHRRGRDSSYICRLLLVSGHSDQGPADCAVHLRLYGEN